MGLILGNAVINITGITVLNTVINMEDSTDTAHLLIIKDEHGGEINIEITFGKITNVKWKE